MYIYIIIITFGAYHRNDDGDDDVNADNNHNQQL